MDDECIGNVLANMVLSTTTVIVAMNLSRHCKMWKNNMFNFKRKRNLATFICFIILAAWNVKIGFDLLKTDFKLFAIIGFSTILFFSAALGTSIRSRKVVMEAYQKSLRQKTSKLRTCQPQKEKPLVKPTAKKKKLQGALTILDTWQIVPKMRLSHKNA